MKRLSKSSGKDGANLNLQLEEYKEYKTKEEKGLDDGEVAASREKHGANIIPKGKRKSFFRRYLEGFSDPIIKILLGALFLNIIFSIGHTDIFETAGIIAAVMISTVVSAISEHGSERAFEKLSEREKNEECRVRRSGKIMKIRTEDVVVGDIVLIGSGERVPADGIIVSGELTVDQSAVNGEAREEKKYPVYDIEYIDEYLTGTEKLSFEMKNAVFKGSTVNSGAGEIRVCFVGGKTLYGSIARSLFSEKRESPLKHRLSELGKNVSVIGYAAAVMVFVAYIFRAFFIENGMDTGLAIAEMKDLEKLLPELISALTLAVSILVVAVPEGLPMMITVVLSSNMKRMLNGNVLIKKLVGIETAGSLNILFCDKTGTLTGGDLKVRRIISAEKEYESIEKMKKDGEIYKILRLSCFYNTESRVGYAGRDKGKDKGREKRRRKCALGGNATDRALLEAALNCEFRAEEAGSIKVVRSRAFNSRNKYSASEVEIDGELISLVKGAPEKIISRCGGEMSSSGDIRAFFSKREITEKYRKLAGEGARVIAVAFAMGGLADEITESGSELMAESGELIFAALVSISDEERPEALSAVEEIQSAGISVVMITGDGRETASSIAKRVGILKSKSDVVLSSDEIKNMTDEEIGEKLPNMRVICRALPSDKERLVKISQSCGLTVGMTGDGVNDAPALKAADVGFALGSGTDVAKEAGDIVILDDNIKSIGRAVLYGRTIFDSIRKFIVFQLTMNLCAVGVSVIGPFIGVESPVTVIQMLWVNLIMDTLGGLAFAGEAPRAEYMKEKPKARNEKILTGKELSRVFITGGAAVMLSLLYLKHPFFRNAFGYENDYLRFITVFFAMFVFCGIFMAFNCRTSQLNLFSHLGENPAFILIMSLTAAVQLLIVYFGGSIFRTEALSVQDLVCALLLAFLVVPIDLMRKLIFGGNRHKNVT